MSDAQSQPDSPEVTDASLLHEPAPILIEAPGDWQRLVERNLTTVLDPMVYRAGEIFLRGRSGHASTGVDA